MSSDLRELLPEFMFWVLLPLWLVAGIADYVLHRRTEIERTSGTGESWLHVVQAAEVGIALLAGLFLEINSLVLAILIGSVIAHMLTSLWDGTYTEKRRYISPLEQHVHSHLEYIPLVAVALVALLHWDAFLGLAGVGTHERSWVLRLKETPLPAAHVAAVLVSVFVVQGALLTEEALRCWRVARRPITARELDQVSDSPASRGPVRVSGGCWWPPGRARHVWAQEATAPPVCPSRFYLTPRLAPPYRR